jgi:serine phosphatase RsbU (regulator of sigma subunit)
MTLRARLVLALFCLAVLPLAGISLYSYVTTERAFRRAVEQESASLAEDLSTRMDAVMADLGQRLQGLGRLPFAKLGQPGEGGDATADRLLAELQQQMGPAAALVESLEFVPARGAARRAGAHPTAEPPEPPPPSAAAVPPEAAAPPGTDTAPTPPDTPRAPGFVFVPQAPAAPSGPGSDAQRWVLRSRLLGRAAEEIGREIGRQAREMGRAASAGQGPDPERARKLAEAQKAIDFLTQRANEVAAAAEAAADSQAAEAARAEAESAKTQAGAEEARKRAARAALRETLRGMAHLAAGAARDAIGEAAHELHVRFGRELGYTLRRDGAELGTLRAQLRSDEILAGVLARTKRRSGEIPFAMDEQGRLFAAERDKPRLAALGLERGVAGQSAAALAKPAKDWIVVTRRDPATGLTLGIARPVGDALREIRATAVRNLGYGLAMVAAAMIGILPLSRRLTRDLGSLSQGAERLARGDLAVQVPVRSRDELGRLAETFNRMARDLRANQHQLLQQERLRKELELGRRIQEEMLPHAPLRAAFAEVKGLSIPAREVGGDFFNYFLLPNGDAALVVGDVSGKGVAAALLMANAQATLKARLPLERDLATLSEHLDREIDESTPTTVYLTGFLGILDASKRTMRYVNAGHNPPLVLRGDGRVEALHATGRPFGLLPGGGYEERVVTFGEGDSLFLYTDGLVESEDDAGEPFGLERLQELVLRKRGGELDRILADVEQAVRDFRSGREAADDATLVLLRVDGAATAAA